MRVWVRPPYIIKQAVGWMVGAMGDNEGGDDGRLGAMEGPVGRAEGPCDGFWEGSEVGEKTSVPVKAVGCRYVTDLHRYIIQRSLIHTVSRQS